MSDEVLPHQVLSGDRLRVHAATRQYLLAMKVYAARPDDVEDVEWLMTELGMTSSQLLPLVQGAYDEETVESHENAINRLVSLLSTWEQPSRDRQGPHPGIDL